MATLEYEYFYSVGDSLKKADLSDYEEDFTLTEDPNYYNSLYEDGTFAHYESQKTPDGGNVQEPLIGSDDTVYYFRGLIQGSDGETYAVYSTAPLGGSGNDYDKSFYIGSNEPIPEDTTFKGRLDTGGDVPVCYLSGTLISTPSGQRPVESLKIGDEVTTNLGVERIKFIGRSTRTLSQLRDQDRMPIRIVKNALGECGPTQDLFISTSHAIYLKGSLVEAGALINGGSVVQLDDLDDLIVTYHNIELEKHGLVEANGLQVESYFSNWRSNGFSRESWDNYSEYLELYGEQKPMVEMDCPRVPFARQLPAEIRLLLQMNESPLQVDSAPALIH